MAFFPNPKLWSRLGTFILLWPVSQWRVEKVSMAQYFVSRVNCPTPTITTECLAVAVVVSDRKLKAHFSRFVVCRAWGFGIVTEEEEDCCGKAAARNNLKCMSTSYNNCAWKYLCRRQGTMAEQGTSTRNRKWIVALASWNYSIETATRRWLWKSWKDVE